METTRSSACMLWVVKTRLEWSWTTQLSLYFSLWIDSTYRYVASLKIKCNSPKKRRKKPWNGLVNTLYHKCCPHSFRLLKPRPQFSSCAASACTCPRTSWPAGVWETSRITSALICLIKASCSTQPHGGGMKKKKKSLFPFLLPKPSEANWCTHLHPFFPLRCELMLGSPFLFLLVLPSLTWIWLSSHPSFFFCLMLPVCPHPSSPYHFWIYPSPFFPLPPHSLLLTHLFLFIWTCTNIDFEWLVVLLELHCQQHRSLKELFMLHQNRNKQYTGHHGGSHMDAFYILVVIRNDC